MDKPLIIRYLNNITAYFIYSFLSLFFKKKSGEKGGYLFINTGDIGDLIISSVILENEKYLLEKSGNSFIVKEQYVDLFKDYTGSIKIIPWNYKKYKGNIFYKIKFLKKIRSLNSGFCINLTAARGITNDELSLLSGADEVWCLNNDWKYLKRIFGKKMERNYDKILFHDINNEYEKHKNLMDLIAPDWNGSFSNKISVVFNSHFSSREFETKKKYITCAPFSSNKFKDWDLEKYFLLFRKIPEDFIIVLLGTGKQKKIIDEKIAQKNIINLAGKTSLNETASIIKNSSAFIGNDSGLTHMALKLQVPLIGLITGALFGRFFPFNENSRTLFHYFKMDCFGCELRCIYDEPKCLTNISVEAVYNSLMKILEYESLNHSKIE